MRKDKVLPQKRFCKPPHFCRLYKKFLGYILTISFLSQLAMAANTEAYRRELEKGLSELLNGRIEPRLFLVFVKVKPLPNESKEKLPFANIDDANGLLRRIADHSTQLEIPSELEFEVILSIDRSVPNGVLDSIKSAIEGRFEIDGQKRILTIKRVEVYDPNAGTRPLTAQEKTKLDAESKRLELENQRIEAEIKITQAKARAMENEEKRQEIAEKELVGKVKEIQPIFAGFLAVLAAIIASFLGGKTIGKGVTQLGQSINTVGKNVADAMNAKIQAEQSRYADEKLAREQAEKSGNAAAELLNEEDSDWTKGHAEYDEYISKIQEKVEILSRERNFVFIRQFLDLLDDDHKTPYAAAILMSLNPETAKLLLQDIGANYLQKVRKILENEGGVPHAKALRHKALQEFFGKIAMSEFTNSPLLELKDAQWLTSMTSSELAEFAANQSDDMRPALLACLTPSRVKKMIESSPTENSRHRLIKALPAINQVTEEKIKNLMKDLVQYTVRNKVEKSRRFADSGEYISTIANELSDQDQKILVDEAKSVPEIQKFLASIFVPFSDLLKVPREIVAELFLNRQNKQIALMIFDASENLRLHVLNALPNIKAESVRDELKVLDTQTAYAVRNKRESKALQKDITKHLIKLSEEGLLSLEPGKGMSQSTTDASTNPSIQSGEENSSISMPKVAA